VTARRSAGTAVAAAVLVLAGATGPAAAAGPSTAWRQSRFHVDVPGVVGRSDVVLRQPALLH
jgi:hypothetical protein